MTEQKRQPNLIKLLDKCPVGAVIILRDYMEENRLQLAKSVRRKTRQRRQTLLIAGDPRIARTSRAEGLHIPSALLTKKNRRGQRTLSAAAHTVYDLARAQAQRIPLILLSPLFKTRSHIGVEGLGIHRFSRLRQHFKKSNIIALGGVTNKTAKQLTGLRTNGIAAIDGWMGE